MMCFGLFLVEGYTCYASVSGDNTGTGSRSERATRAELLPNLERNLAVSRKLNNMKKEISVLFVALLLGIVLNVPISRFFNNLHLIYHSDYLYDFNFKSSAIVISMLVLLNFFLDKLFSRWLRNRVSWFTSKLLWAFFSWLFMIAFIVPFSFVFKLSKIYNYAELCTLICVWLIISIFIKMRLLPGG